MNIFELVTIIIFAVSILGIAFILFRKLPVLVALPQNGTTGIRKHRIILDVENKIKDILLFFKKQIFFHKFLSWVKIMTLKVETRVDHLLHRIRKKAQKIDQEVNRPK